MSFEELHTEARRLYKDSGIVQKILAERCELSPSHVSRALREKPNSGYRFAVVKIVEYFTGREITEEISYIVGEKAK